MTKRDEALKQLRDLTDEELDQHLRQQRRRLFEIRFQQATGQVENHRQVREVRHEIARAMTVQIENARGLRPESAPVAVTPRPRPAATAEPAASEASEPDAPEPDDPDEEETSLAETEPVAAEEPEESVSE